MIQTSYAHSIPQGKCTCAVSAQNVIPTPLAGGTIQFFSDPYCEQSAGESVTVVGNCTVPHIVNGGQVFLQMGCMDHAEDVPGCGNQQCAVTCQGESASNCNAAAAAPQNAFHDDERCTRATTGVCQMIIPPNATSPKAVYGRITCTGVPLPPPEPPHENPVPPMIIVPGLTNSVIQYELDDASPVPLLKCNTTTNGEWLQLYPPVDTTVNGLLCFIQNFGFTYDTTANKIVPKRKGVNTRYPCILCGNMPCDRQECTNCTICTSSRLVVWNLN
eukprot:m.1123531 g.1123531  ORF g.1123531 m.1123531 type:complete len:274 (-) comp24405_c1_seq12:1589-2410(-)